MAPRSHAGGGQPRHAGVGDHYGGQVTASERGLRAEAAGQERTEELALCVGQWCRQVGVECSAGAMASDGDDADPSGSAETEEDYERRIEEETASMQAQILSDLRDATETTEVEPGAPP